MNELNITRIIDLTQDIYHNCPVLPEFSPPKLDYILLGPRDGWNLEQLTMNLHTATHMDAPAHMADFRLTLDAFPVERFQGRLVVLDLTGKQPGEPVTAEDLFPYKDRLSGEPVVFLYTGWGQKRSWTREFIYESPYLSREGARYLADRGVRGVGIDHFSIGGTGPDNEEIHRTLLGSEIWIAEGLQLDDPALFSGEWHVFSLPIKIRDSSGAPARVVAIQWE